MNPNPTTEKLSPDQRQRLDELEASMDSAQRAGWTNLARPLTVIKTEKLYLDTHATFGAYTEARHQIKQSRAYQLVRALRAHDALVAAGVTDLPLNENQLRPFAKLSADEVVVAWRHAVNVRDRSRLSTTTSQRKSSKPLALD